MPRSKKQSASPQRSHATVQKAGSKTYVEIPFEPNEVWGDKERHYVTETVGSCKFRGLLLFDGSQFVLPLGAAWVRDNPVKVGDVVAVELEPDGPVLERLDADIASAIAGDPQAKRFFESVAPFYRKNAIRWIESAKRAETRAARIIEVVRMLAAGKTM